MSLEFDDAPGWKFHVEEVSAGVYEVTASSERGQRLQSKGMDPDELLLEARREVMRLDRA